MIVNNIIASHVTEILVTNVFIVLYVMSWQ